MIFKISCPQSPKVLEILLLSSVPTWSFCLFQVGELFKSALNSGNSYFIDEKFWGTGIPMGHFLESIVLSSFPKTIFMVQSSRTFSKTITSFSSLTTSFLYLPSNNFLQPHNYFTLFPTSPRWYEKKKNVALFMLMIFIIIHIKFDIDINNDEWLKTIQKHKNFFYKNWSSLIVHSNTEPNLLLQEWKNGK